MKTVLIIGLLMVMLPIQCNAPAIALEVQPEPIAPAVKVAVEPVEPVESVVEPEPVPEKITFRVTAYCSCYECCGKWALNRPIDENGHEIVRGASGERLIANYSCASPYPFGTKIEVDGLGTFEVQDRTAQWVVDQYGENIIDVYVDNHEDIAKIGRQFLEGVIVE
jgi:3D (Asp-Asp-Asp) domain-containing protein